MPRPDSAFYTQVGKNRIGKEVVASAFYPNTCFVSFLKFSEFLFIQDWKNEVKDNRDGSIRIPRHCILVNFWTETREKGFGFDSWFQSHQGEEGRTRQPSSQQQCGTGAVHRAESREQEPGAKLQL